MENLVKSALDPRDIELDVLDDSFGGYPSELLLFSSTIVDDSLRQPQVMEEGAEKVIPFVHCLLLYMPRLMSPLDITIYSEYYTKDGSPVEMCKNQSTISKSDFNVYAAPYSLLMIPNEMRISPDINEPIQDQLVTQVESGDLSIRHLSNYADGESIDVGEYVSKVPFSVMPFGRQGSEKEEVSKIKIETPDRVKIDKKQELNVDQEKLQTMIKSMIRNLIK